jgi:uncharacterized protein (DUF305 family)
MKILLTVAFALTLAACGTDATAHNAKDVEFAANMIPHHQQALTMTELARTKNTNDKVRELAETIEGGQHPEVVTMNQWLRRWGEPQVDNSSHVSMHGDDHAMNGMLTDSEMSALRSADGAEFDRLFLQGMIKHHQGAIDMCDQEKSAGSARDAKRLAAVMSTTQKVEIDTMRKLQSELGLEVGDAHSADHHQGHPSQAHR